MSKQSMPKPKVVNQCEVGNFTHALTSNPPCRRCGRFACDDCTDMATELCMACVPVDDEAYANECLVKTIVQILEDRQEARHVN